MRRSAELPAFQHIAEQIDKIGRGGTVVIVESGGVQLGSEDPSFSERGFRHRASQIP